MVGQVTRPGGRLLGLVHLPITRQVIRNLPWDYVVLQEHATVKSTEAQAASPPLFDREAASASARLVYTVRKGTMKMLRRRV